MKRRSGNGGRSDSGFTLLEVLMATAVLAVGLVPLLVTHATTVANIRRSREMTVALLQTRDRLAELEAYGYLVLSGEEGGFGLDGSPGPGSEEHRFLKFEEEIKENEKLEVEMLEVRAGASRKFRPGGEKEDPAGSVFSTNVVHLYFETEEKTVEE